MFFTKFGDELRKNTLPYPKLYDRVYVVSTYDNQAFRAFLRLLSIRNIVLLCTLILLHILCVSPNVSAFFEIFDLRNIQSNEPRRNSLDLYLCMCGCACTLISVLTVAIRIKEKRKRKGMVSQEFNWCDCKNIQPYSRLVK